MNLQLSLPYLILCSVLLLLFLISHTFLLRNNTKSMITKNGHHNLPIPPGTTGWPFVGETLSYMSMARKGLQHKFISDRTAKHSSPSIFRTSLFGETMAVMATPEGNKFLFSNENNLVQSWWPSSMVAIFNAHDTPASPNDSKNFRRLLVPPFLKPNSLQKYVATINSLTEQNLLPYTQQQAVVKLHSLAKHHIAVISCKLFLSIKDEETEAKIEKLLGQIESGIVAVPIDMLGTKYRRAKRASREFHKEVLAMIKQRRARNGDVVGDQLDLLSCLLLQAEGGEFLKDDSDISNHVLSFIFPSYHETSTVITSIVHCLAEHPQVYDSILTEQMEIANSKGQDEMLNWEDIQKMTYSWNVVKEVLRLFPAGLGGFREAITDFNYEGFVIPKGWKVHWSVYATHQNPKYFMDPEKFDPSRFERNDPIAYTYVPFGGGPRMCPGKSLARLQILVFIHNLITKFDFKKVFEDEKLVYGPILIPTKGLPVRLYPRKSV